MRIGSLLINPAPRRIGRRVGPLCLYPLPVDVRSRFDIIGFDPRGVGGSLPPLNASMTSTRLLRLTSPRQPGGARSRHR